MTKCGSRGGRGMRAFFEPSDFHGVTQMCFPVELSDYYGCQPAHFHVTARRSECENRHGLHEPQYRDLAYTRKATGLSLAEPPSELRAMEITQSSAPLAG